MTKPLMPKATAMWLLNQTTLTFDQIADFCVLHPLEVKAMADDMHPEKIVPLDPVMMGQLTREEIEKAEKDPKRRLTMTKPAVDVAPAKTRGRYTPVSRRQDRPDAIAWLVRNHPELTDAEIGKLVGTTKATITQIRNRSHWNMANIKPADPVTLSLCSQLELDLAVEKAAARKARNSPAEPRGATLKPASEAVKENEEQAQAAEGETQQHKYDPASVFASFQRARDKS